MLLERSQMFRRHSVERDKVRFDPRLYLSSHLSFCSLQSLSIVRLLLSYPKFFRTRLVMVFPLASFLSFDEHRRSPFLPNDLDDRFVCFSLLLCSFHHFYVGAAASCCTLHVSYMLSSLSSFSPSPHTVFVRYNHAISIHVSFWLSRQLLLKTPTDDGISITWANPSNLCSSPS